jgi:hypothetical protein
MTDTIEELVKMHDAFVRKVMKERGKLVSQIVFSKNREVFPMICLGGRDEIKMAMVVAKRQDPDWIVVMNEGYIKKFTRAKGESIEKMKEREMSLLSTHQTGDLEREFNLGNPDIKEVVILTVYTRDKKMSVTYEKIGNKLKKLYETDDFAGYLTYDDMDIFKKIRDEK